MSSQTDKQPLLGKSLLLALLGLPLTANANLMEQFTDPIDGKLDTSQYIYPMLNITMLKAQVFATLLLVSLVLPPG